MRIAIYKDKQLLEKFCGNAKAIIHKYPTDDQFFSMAIGMDSKVVLHINFDETDLVVEDDVSLAFLSEEDRLKIKNTICPSLILAGMYKND